LLLAALMARAAVGLPICLAIWACERVSQNSFASGQVFDFNWSSDHTRFVDDAWHKEQ